MGGLVCIFCGCSVTSSRSVKENIGAVKSCFCYSDFGSVSLILVNVETLVSQPCEILHSQRAK